MIPNKASLLTALPISALLLVSAAAQGQTLCKDERKIVGGVDTTIEEHPWQVALSIQSPDGTNFCGGSLIQDRWVLTAAHCFPSKNATAARVKAGQTNHSAGSWIETGKIFVHEGYSSNTQENDIALIKLNAGVTGEIIPLAQGSEELKPCQMLEVTGWGAIKEAKQAGAETLQRAEVPLVDNATCNAKDAYDGAINAGMMCAGYHEGGIDACQGDSGGPLVLRGKDGPVLVGVVSWGEGCARKLRYGVYTRVDAYSGWIADTILANQN
jgi:secreted trypsin-like serine protease